MDEMLPGHRLKAYRIDKGFKTRKEFCSALELAGLAVAYQRISKLERSETNPDFYELNAITQFLGLTADCWLRGICHTLQDDIISQTQFLNDRQIRLILELALGNATVLHDHELR